MVASEIVFGTSGLRGPATGFTTVRISAYVSAFLAVCCANVLGRPVLIGFDLRESSPAIAKTVARAVIAANRQVINGGTVPTPALAAYALARNLPAIMVTGSHTPPERNGLKFYRPDGELLKADEAPITKAAHEFLSMSGNPVMPNVSGPALPAVSPEVETEYSARYTRAFSTDALAGLTVGILQHSAVGRDLVTAILSRLGAHCVPFARTDSFVGVDTEALAPDMMEAARRTIVSHRLDAVVSTDGDGDRPLLIDENGDQIPGDILGTVSARMLGTETLVTPLTSTSAIELSGWFARVERTRIGSPFVVQALRAATGTGVVAGFEANGGFLLQTAVPLSVGTLAPLPTRDALLPLIAGLATARNAVVPVSQIGAHLPKRVMKAGRIKPVAPVLGRTFLDRIAADTGARAKLHHALAAPCAIDLTDGVRLTRPDGTIVHFRQSGNAPEMRCYVETGSLSESEAELDALLTNLERHLKELNAS